MTPLGTSAKAKAIEAAYEVMRFLVIAAPTQGYANGVYWISMYFQAVAKFDIGRTKKLVDAFVAGAPCDHATKERCFSVLVRMVDEENGIYDKVKGPCVDRSKELVPSVSDLVFKSQTWAHLEKGEDGARAIVSVVERQIELVRQRNRPGVSTRTPPPKEVAKPVEKPRRGFWERLIK